MRKGRRLNIEALVAALEARRVTEGQLARWAGVDEQVVQGLEAGEAQRLDHVLLVCDQLDIEVWGCQLNPSHPIRIKHPGRVRPGELLSRTQAAVEAQTGQKGRKTR
jgi:DNA-binding Xre family transcriptional regulator